MQLVVTIGDTWPEPATLPWTGRVANVKVLENCSFPHGSMANRLLMSKETQVPFTTKICTSSINVVWPTLVPSFVGQRSKAMAVALEKQRFDTYR